ncbi:MAG: HAMP domain-containing protein [Clostridia bacterium]|nr:HAMP domain-containing protein [Clostridia bacterium]
MKRISIKLRVTFWFTFIMIILFAAMLFFLISASERTVYEETKLKLTDAVDDSFKEIDYRFGRLDIDDDLDYYNDGVYIAVYDSDGKLLYGRLPTGFDRSLKLSSDELQTIGSSEQAQYVYDLTRDVGKGYMVTVRGVMTASGSEHAFSAIVKLALVTFPILIVIAAVVGYWITRSAFKPVKRIADSAEMINSGQDLTKRIGLADGGDEIHKLANEFDLMLDRLQESFENEKRFTSDASHELRTPMAVIISEAEAALESDETIGVARKSLESIHATAEEMSRLISCLLMLSRADKGHLKVNKERLDLSEIVSGVTEQAGELASDKDIIVVSDIEQDVFVDGDTTMLIRMLLNLCENGIKYGRVGGELKVTLKSENGNAVCDIEDNGIGISEEHLEKIWGRFFRADESRSSGNGLGLPLARYIANAHDGDISVVSTLGEGSVFTVVLPLADL